MKGAILLLLGLFLVAVTASSKPYCLGYPDIPDLDMDCRKRTDEVRCMEGFALRSANLSASCIWHQLASTKTIDRQYVYNRGSGVVLSGIDYKGTVCATTLNVTMPARQTGRWGTYMRLLGGPQNTSVFTSSIAPRISFMTASCQVGKGFPASCKARLAPPEGYARNPNFKSNSAVFEFFTSDSRLMKQWSENSRLNGPSTLKYKIELHGIRCRGDFKPKPTPAVLDKATFGPSAYQLTLNTKHYSLTTYRAYRVTNVTGVSWNVRVYQSLEKSGEITPLVVMLIREKDYLAWSEACNTTCAAPEELAVPGTLCKSKSCKGRKLGLGAINGVHRLLVSYPNVTAFDYEGNFSNKTPVPTEFNKQIVRTEIWPRYWKFQEGGSSSDVRDIEAIEAGIAKTAVDFEDVDIEPSFGVPAALGDASETS